MAIIFPRKEAFDFDRDAVNFPAEIDGKTVQCSISTEALHDNFGGDRMDPVDCFRANRARVEAKAESLIKRGRTDEAGVVRIGTGDGR